jgi:hypothetical protein
MSTGRITLIVGLLVLAWIDSPPGAEARTWTDSSGRFTVEAEFVELADGNVVLKKQDGTTIKLPLDKLISKDQDAARALGKVVGAIGQETAQAPGKAALVIGNSAYDGNMVLRNPGHDADDMEKALRDLDFSVTTKKDLDQQGMEDALLAFRRKLKKGDLALFFYSGHGLQVEDQNYLVPIGAKLEEEYQVKRQCFQAAEVLDAMEESECNLKVVVLDCCRNNPLKRSWKRGQAKRGLAGISNVPEGTVLAFSTSPNTEADDGAGEHSPYSEQLLAALKRRPPEGLELREVFFDASRAVKKQTGQVPWLNLEASLEKYYLWKASSSAVQTVPVSAGLQKPGLNGDVHGGLGVTVTSSHSVVVEQRPAPPKAPASTGLFGKIAGELGAGGGVATIRQALEGFPANCISADPVGEPKLLEKETATAKIQVEVQIQADREAYKAFATKLTRTLDSVAKEKGDFSSTTSTQTNPGARFVPPNARYKLPQMGPPFGRGQYVLKNEVIKCLPMIFDGERNSGTPESWKPGMFTVAINTEVTNAGEQLHWRYYNLDRGLGDLFIKAALREGKCSVNLLDASGDIVAAERFTPKCGDSAPWNASLLTLIGSGEEGLPYTVEVRNPPPMDVQAEKMHLVLIAPLFLWQSGGRHAPTLTFPVTMSLSHDEIKRVVKAKCELTFNEK